MIIENLEIPILGGLNSKVYIVRLRSEVYLRHHISTIRYSMLGYSIGYNSGEDIDLHSRLPTILGSIFRVGTL